MKPVILVSEDDNVQREIIADILETAGYAVLQARNGAEAIEHLRREPANMLLTDMRMPGMNGLELLRQAKKLRPECEVVMMTAFATVQTAVTAMKEGASDYLAKPFDKDELLVVAAKAVERGDLLRQNRQLRDLLTDSVSMGNIIGNSPPMQRVFDVTQKAVQVTSTVLIQGESGTGKELIARHIHFTGPRARKPFIVMNCAAIPESLVESELFGHEKGAFTGADASRTGKFEVADGGTLFLDEIGDMQLSSQAKLLRVLQDGLVERVGSSQPRKVDVRVIVATNRDLAKRVEEGRFRKDLYYRLDVLRVDLPPLRDRIQDLPLLISHFRQKLSAKLQKPSPSLGADVVERMRRYRWPGNVRELENTLEQLFILCDGESITLDDLPAKLREKPSGPCCFQLPPGGIVLEQVEQDFIRQAMEQSGGSIKEAADLLGLTYKTLQYRLKKHEIEY